MRIVAKAFILPPSPVTFGMGIFGVQPERRLTHYKGHLSFMENECTGFTRFPVLATFIFTEAGFIKIWAGKMRYCVYLSKFMVLLPSSINFDVTDTSLVDDCRPWLLYRISNRRSPCPLSYYAACSSITIE